MEETKSGVGIFIGQRFGKYVIEEELGRGGMGMVFRATDLQLQRPVALKVLLSGAFDNQEKINRFVAEAKATAKLVHPNIIRLYDYGYEQNVCYFTMDYIEGTTLDKFVRENAVDFKQQAALIQKICEAIHYAHQQKIIHRDLKPSNIMVSKDGTPYVMDFGIAKVEDDDQQMTRTGEIIGTPAYMSPEQAGGHLKQMDHRSDIYSIGAILYEIISGRRCFTAETSIMLIMKILKEIPPTPHSIENKIPRALSNICMKALQKDKNKRYNTALEMAEDLQKFIDGKMVSAKSVLTKPISNKPVSAKPSGRSKRRLHAQAKVRSPKSNQSKWAIVAFGVFVLAFIFLLIPKPNPLVKKAEEFIVEGKIDVAKEMINEVLQENPDNRKALSLRQKIREIEVEQKQQIVLGLREAENSFLKGDFVLAERKLKNLQSSFPQESQISDLLQRIQKAQNEYLEAKELVHEKELSKADQKIAGLLKEMPGYQNAIDLQKQIEAAIKTEEQRLSEKHPQNRPVLQHEEVPSLLQIAIDRLNSRPFVRGVFNISKMQDHMKKGEIDEAAALLKESLEKTPMLKAIVGEDILRKLKHSSPKRHPEKPAKKFFVGEQRWPEYLYKNTKPKYKHRYRNDVEKMIFRIDGHKILDMGSPTWKEMREDQKRMLANRYQRGYAGDLGLEPEKIVYIKGVPLKLCFIPPGRFFMGAPSEDENSRQDEVPQREIVISKPFWLGKYEFTERQWFGDIGGDRPITEVSWEKVNEFIQAEIPGGRLPTEAEWEYAARSGSLLRFYWGSEPEYIHRHAWIHEKQKPEPFDVGTKRESNPWGLKDILGNVHEWCGDYYRDYSNHEVVSGGLRVYRGGCWKDIWQDCRVSRRFSAPANIQMKTVGFRVVIDIAAF